MTLGIQVDDEEAESTASLLGAEAGCVLQPHQGRPHMLSPAQVFERERVYNSSTKGSFVVIIVCFPNYLNRIATMNVGSQFFLLSLSLSFSLIGSILSYRCIQTIPIETI